LNKLKFLIFVTLAVLALLYFSLDVGRFLTLDYLQGQLAGLQAYTRDNFFTASLIYLLGYILFTALSIPGSLLLTLAGGAVFGLVWGTVLVSFASSIGATLAFLTSRWLLRDWVQSRFGDYLAPVNRGMAKDGTFYLFSIRMVPLFPFFAINLMMGLTSIPVKSYYLASQGGMLLATIVFVNAGAELGQITSLSGLVSPSLLASFALLGLFPLIARFIVGALRRRHTPRKFPRPRHFDVNVVVIGAGSAGLVASLIVAGAKAKVVLVEKHRMGGDCLNTGCVPSKTLIRSGRVASYLRRAPAFGLGPVPLQVDFPAVMQRVQDVIGRIEPHDSVERFTSLGVECVAGEARIISPYCVRVNDRDITTRAIILATGARPLVPPIPGLEQVDYLTSDSVWGLEDLPERLLVVGAGPIGCELAQAFHNLGSRVTLVDQASRILSREDTDVSELLTTTFRAQGIEVMTDCSILRFGRGEEGQYMVGQSDSTEVTRRFDKVLLALGRKANVEGFGLEELQLPLTPQGMVEVNEYLQTAYPSIYACGDVVGPYQFTHMASFQAWYAAINALIGGLRKTRVNYKVVPWATFTTPEIARVGLSEQEARARGIPYELTRYDLDDLDRAIADGDSQGFIKVLTKPGRDRILGATIVGAQAGELITEFVMAMTHGLGLRKIAATTHIYPTLSEGNRFAANAWRKARVPTRVMPWLERLFSWQRGAPDRSRNDGMQ
jgi:pyruvate/2-oxoglutarate dehydrogenase complex dihydrolipoamide dehydrogenase (E3) component/uncharacterized membrane protein YdjX (TVP38/TMEM64 family)